MASKRNALLLFPNVLGPHRRHEAWIPAGVDRAVEKIDGLIAESEKQGRLFLSRFDLGKRPQDVPLALFSEHTSDGDLDFLLEPMVAGERWGYVSDAGLPCIADPGARLVFRARQLGIPVKAFVGPSSISLALMLSGLPGQRFAFHGYLPRQRELRVDNLRRLEERSRLDLATQVVMEAPYRNEAMLEDLLNTLDPDTLLAVAWELTCPDQGVICEPVSTWKKMTLPNLNKKPAMFLMYAGNWAFGREDKGR